MLGGLGALVVFGVLVFQPGVNRAVSEWERQTPPPEIDQPTAPTTLYGATAAYNPTLAAQNPRLGGYFAWAVGKKWLPASNQQGVVLRFNRHNWETKLFPCLTCGTTPTQVADSLNGVATWLDDNGTGTGPDDFHRVWAVGRTRYPAVAGVVLYSETNSTTGTATPWSNCVTNHVSGACEPITFTGGSPQPFNAVDFFSAGQGLAVGDNCEVWKTVDSGKTWTQTTSPGGCGSGNLTSVAFLRNFSAPYDPATSLNVPRTSFAWVTAENSNKAWFSNDFGATWSVINIPGAPNDWYGVTAFTHSSLGVTNNAYVWIVGEGGRVRRAICTEATPTTCESAVFDDAGPSGQAGLGSVTLRSAASFIDTTSPIKYMLWASAGTMPSPPATPPTDGAISFTMNPTATSAADVLWQSQSINTAQTVFDLAVVNGTHAWAVGDQATLLKLSPGNVNGWLWIGADNCRDLCIASPSNNYCANFPTCQGGAARTRPLGWLSVNCANTGTCQAATFNYGVNLKQKKEKVGAITTCQQADQDTDVGALSGFGWFGVSDATQRDPTTGQTCQQNPSVCRPIGWLSFERTYFCTGDLQKTCRQNSDCTGFGTCNIAGGTPPTPPFNTFDFTSACNKTITNNSSQQYVQALYDYETDRVEGWARFVAPEHLTNNTGWVKLRGPYMCGTAWCVKDRSRACSPTAPCGAGDSCDYQQPNAQPYGACTRASTPVNPATDTHYSKCTDCVTNNNGTPATTADDFLTCNICTHVQTTDWWDAAYTTRRQLRVSMGTTPGTVVDTVSFLLNVDALPGIKLPNYEDVRVIYQTDTGFYELAREIVNFTPGNDPADEEIRFKLARPIAAGDPDTNYYLYYANPAATAPAMSLANVYRYFDDMSAVPINVTTSTTPWQTSVSGSGLFHGTSGEMQVTQKADNIWVYNIAWQLDATKTWNLEADVRLIASVGSWGADLQGLAYIGHVAFPPNPSPTWDAVWAPLINQDPNDRIELWRSQTPGKFYPTAGNVAQPVDVGLTYRMRWREDFSNPSDRRHNLWIDGAQKVTDVTEPLVNTPDTIFYPGFYAGDTNSAYDNVRVWQALGETIVPNAGEESNIGAQRAVNPWSCNQCGFTGASGNTQCGTGRCLPTAPVPYPYATCLNEEQCGGTTGTTNYCSPSGRCSDTGAICFGDFAGVRTGFCNSALGSTCRDIGENVCNECTSCSLYGVSADTRGGALYGFGYSEDYGFVDFSFSFLYNRSWLQVLRGGIYSRSGVGSPVTGKPPGVGSATRPEPRCNATFVIRSSGGIANVCSSYQALNPPSEDPTTSPYVNPGFSPFDLPAKENQFRSEAGRVRINDLIDDPDGDGIIDEDGNGRNKFQQPVIDISNFTPRTWSRVNSILGVEWLRNRVFYYHPATPTPFEFDTAATFKAFANYIGRGTFVFEGSNVTIKQDMAYDTLVPPTALRELASLGIIVIRDRAPGSPDVSVTIEKDVRRTVGNYYVEGMMNIEGSATSAQPDDPYQNDGVMVARGFKFGRRIKGPIDNPQPSEIILNDGRLSLNPPPGFEGFSQNLPQIRESVP